MEEFQDNGDIDNHSSNLMLAVECDCALDELRQLQKSRCRPCRMISPGAHFRSEHKSELHKGFPKWLLDQLCISLRIFDLKVLLFLFIFLVTMDGWYIRAYMPPLNSDLLVIYKATNSEKMYYRHNRQDKPDWHSNLDFQDTCVGQRSQFLRGFWRHWRNWLFYFKRIGCSNWRAPWKFVPCWGAIKWFPIWRQFLLRAALRLTGVAGGP